VAKPRRKIKKKLDCFGDLVEHVQCGTCKKWLPATTQFFSANSGKPMGLNSMCKACHNAYIQNRRATAGTKVWFSAKAAQARKRAKSKGFPFDLKYEDLECPTHCPMSGMKLDYGLFAGGKKRPHSASLDRIDSSLGYIRGNVRVTSWIANYWKSDYKEEEFLGYIQQFYFHMFARMKAEASMAEWEDLFCDSLQ
jgi:hypothetical protein